MKAFGFQWHLSDRCNLRCQHCYQEDFTPRSERSLAELREMGRRILSAMADREVSINLTGGEPLLYPKLFDLIEFLQGFDNLREIHLITNGMVASDAVMDNLRRYPKIRCLKVSVESGDGEVNDRIRGQGNLEKVGQNVRTFRERSGKEIVLMTTLGQYNLDSIPCTVEFAQDLRVAGIIFERFVPLGQGQAIGGEALDAAAWQRAVQEITTMAELDVDPQDLLPFRAFWLWLDGRIEDRLQGALCNLGDESMALMPDATVYPCRRLPVPVGNLLEEPFEAILPRLASWSVPSLQRRLRGELCGMCGVEACAGCRAMAFSRTGDPWADDPQCGLSLERP